jgi:hypothetical protein
MATQSEKIQKIKEELESLKGPLVKYGNIFNANGDVDTDEQKQLNYMQSIINQAYEKLASLQDGNSETKSTPKVRDKHKGKYNYGEIVAELFVKGAIDENKIDPNDVQQGQLGDCYFLAAIAAVARANPKALEKLIKDNGDGTYDVTLYVYNNFLSWSRSPTVIKVKPEFPKKADGTPAYAKAGDNELWVMLLEKAYAQYEGSYGDIHGGYTEKGIGVLTGENATSYDVSDYTDKEILETFADAIKKKQPIVADSKKIGKKDKEKSKLAKGLNIIGGHSYPVKGVSGNNISLQNPWTNVNTGNASDNYDITLSVSDFKKYFNDFNIKK